jgi:integrase
VFTVRGDKPFNSFDNAKERLDKCSGIIGWRLHDLRRTAATEMARLGIAQHVVEKLLNHRSGSIRGVAAVYNRHSYLDERRYALEAWARRLETIVDRSASNVVELIHRP